MQVLGQAEINCKSIDVKTDLGAIKLNLSPILAASHYFRCSAGSINLNIKNYNGSFELKSTAGKATISGMDVNITSQTNPIVGSYLLGQVGMGSGSLKATTDLGTIGIVCQTVPK
jgi:hypothetical protein